MHTPPHPPSTLLPFTLLPSTLLPSTLLPFHPPPLHPPPLPGHTWGIPQLLLRCECLSRQRCVLWPHDAERLEAIGYTKFIGHQQYLIIGFAQVDTFQNYFPVHSVFVLVSHSTILLFSWSSVLLFVHLTVYTPLVLHSTVYTPLVLQDLLQLSLVPRFRPVFRRLQYGIGICWKRNRTTL